MGVHLILDTGSAQSAVPQCVQTPLTALNETAGNSAVAGTEHALKKGFHPSVLDRKGLTTPCRLERGYSTSLCR